MKKIINMKNSLAILALMVVTFSSCLKEKYRTDFTTVPDVVEQPYPGFMAKGFAYSTDPQPMVFWVNLAAVNPRSSDLTVTVAKDDAAIQAYNDENGTDYEALPDSSYSFPATSFTIPAGQREAQVNVEIFTNKIDLTKPYMFAYTITDAQGVTIAENRKTTLYSILVKNQYDGLYHATGYFAHPTAPRPIDRDTELSTYSANQVTKELGDLGSTQVILTVNADNTVNVTPGPGTSGTTAQVHLMLGDPVYNNTYDPATKTFYLHYGYPVPETRIITEKVELK